MDARRLEAEADLLAQVFPGVGAGLDPQQGNGWVHIPSFPLPAGWSRSTTNLMVIVPGSYPHLPPDSFYVEKHLRDARGRPIDHYFEGAGHNRFAHRGWAWFCYHVRGPWRPTVDPYSGDSLATYVNLIGYALQGVVR